MELSDRPHWQLGLERWEPLVGARARLTWRRLPCLPHPLPFLEESPGKLDGELQRLLDLLPQPVALPAAPKPIHKTVTEMLPIGLFLRGISFSGQPVVRADEIRLVSSCRHFFRYQVNWHGAGSDRSVDLVQLSAWATAEAIERSRKATPVGPPTVRQFFRQITWSGVSST